jgi:hypothetical protein
MIGILTDFLFWLGFIAGGATVGFLTFWALNQEPEDVEPTE